MVLNGVLCRAVNRYLKLKELLQACPFVVMFPEIYQKMNYPRHLPLASAADNKRAQHNSSIIIQYKQPTVPGVCLTYPK